VAVQSVPATRVHCAAEGAARVSQRHRCMVTRRQPQTGEGGGCGEKRRTARDREERRRQRQAGEGGRHSCSAGRLGLGGGACASEPCLLITLSCLHSLYTGLYHPLFASVWALQL